MALQPACVYSFSPACVCEIVEEEEREEEEEEEEKAALMKLPTSTQVPASGALGGAAGAGRGRAVSTQM